MLVGGSEPFLGSDARPEAATFSAGAIHLFSGNLYILLLSVVLLAVS
jgi:hypothetical protein